MLTRLSSKTPCLIFTSISFAESSKAFSTFKPDFALDSTNKRPSDLANSSASSAETSLARRKPETVGSASPSGEDCDCSGGDDSLQRSTLFPTSMHVTWGSAFSRTSASQERIFMKPVMRTLMCNQPVYVANGAYSFG